MTKITLMHKNLMNSDEVNEKGWDAAFWNIEKVAVAELYAEHTDEEHMNALYASSQHINENWTCNPLWRTIFSDREATRSTKVGDYFVIENEEGTRGYIVDSFGFTRVPYVGAIPEGEKAWKYM